MGRPSIDSMPQTWPGAPPWVLPGLWEQQLIGDTDMPRKTRDSQAKNAGHPNRRVRYGVAMSLDGFIAGPSGEADWIIMDPEIDELGRIHRRSERRSRLDHHGPRD